MNCQRYYLVLLLVVSSTIGVAQRKTDERAIRAVLESHSLACLDADAEKAIGYYAHSPYVATAFSEPGYHRGYDAVAAAYRNEFANGQKSPDKLTTGAYQYRIVGKVAFVTYIETYTKPDGTRNISHKAGYLEKEKGQWKLIGNFWITEKAP